MEWPGRSKIEGEVTVVFAQVIPTAVDAARDASCRIGDTAGRSAGATGGICHIRDRLGSVCLHAHVEQEARRQLRVGTEVELMPLVPVGERVLPSEIVKVHVAKGEGVALVGIVVEVLGYHIVGVQLQMLAEALSYADGPTAVKGSRRAFRVRNIEQAVVRC